MIKLNNSGIFIQLTSTNTTPNYSYRNISTKRIFKPVSDKLFTNKKEKNIIVNITHKGENMKKLFSILALVVVLQFFFCGCDDESNDTGYLRIYNEYVESDYYLYGVRVGDASWTNVYGETYTDYQEIELGSYDIEFMQAGGSWSTVSSNQISISEKDAYYTLVMESDGYYIEVSSSKKSSSDLEPYQVDTASFSKF